MKPSNPKQIKIGCIDNRIISNQAYRQAIFVVCQLIFKSHFSDGLEELVSFLVDKKDNDELQQASNGKFVLIDKDTQLYFDANEVKTYSRSKGKAPLDAQPIVAKKKAANSNKKRILSDTNVSDEEDSDSNLSHCSSSVTQSDVTSNNAQVESSSNSIAHTIRTIQPTDRSPQTDDQNIFHTDNVENQSINPVETVTPNVYDNPTNNPQFSIIESSTRPISTTNDRNDIQSDNFVQESIVANDAASNNDTGFTSNAEASVVETTRSNNSSSSSNDTNNMQTQDIEGGNLNSYVGANRDACVDDSVSNLDTTMRETTQFDNPRSSGDVCDSFQSTLIQNQQRDSNQDLQQVETNSNPNENKLESICLMIQDAFMKLELEVADGNSSIINNNRLYGQLINLVQSASNLEQVEDTKLIHMFEIQRLIDQFENSEKHLRQSSQVLMIYSHFIRENQMKLFGNISRSQAGKKLYNELKSNFITSKIREQGNISLNQQIILKEKYAKEFEQTNQKIKSRCTRGQRLAKFCQAFSPSFLLLDLYWSQLYNLSEINLQELIVRLEHCGLKEKLSHYVDQFYKSQISQILRLVVKEDNQLLIESPAVNKMKLLQSKVQHGDENSRDNINFNTLDSTPIQKRTFWQNGLFGGLAKRLKR